MQTGTELLKSLQDQVAELAALTPDQLDEYFSEGEEAETGAEAALIAKLKGGR